MALIFMEDALADPYPPKNPHFGGGGNEPESHWRGVLLAGTDMTG